MGSANTRLGSKNEALWSKVEALVSEVAILKIKLDATAKETITSVNRDFDVMVLEKDRQLTEAIEELKRAKEELAATKDSVSEVETKVALLAQTLHSSRCQAPLLPGGVEGCCVYIYPSKPLILVFTLIDLSKTQASLLLQQLFTTKGLLKQIFGLMAKYAFSNILVFIIDEDGDDDRNTTPTSAFDSRLVLALTVIASLVPELTINTSFPPLPREPLLSSWSVRQ
ncbi:hypothetical protein Adt_14423 [Abeliophyllum distichum]|uniref:Uncharacterized protein n=1 Tax=Abeliophyllum distichum TaxID=126358 RepID=A0ABD1TZL4_9LAMI